MALTICKDNKTWRQWLLSWWSRCKQSGWGEHLGTPTSWSSACVWARLSQMFGLGVWCNWWHSNDLPQQDRHQHATQSPSRHENTVGNAAPRRQNFASKKSATSGWSIVEQWHCRTRPHPTPPTMENHTRNLMVISAKLFRGKHLRKIFLVPFNRLQQFDLA